MNRYRVYILVGCVFFLVLALSLKKNFANIDQTYRVQYVNDGDTIVLNDHRRIRYIGIDAPEIDHKHHKADAFGYEAADYNRYLLKDRLIRLEADVEKTDHYGRTLAYVFLDDGTFVNRKMIESGFAYYFFKAPNQKYSKILLEAQHNAMNQKNGLWKHFKNQYRSYIGNSKTRRFHRKNCRYAKKVSKQNIIIWQDKQSAFWHGFSPCRRCKP